MSDVHRQKLARVLGLLGSPHDGEALAAGRAAETLRSRAGVSWAKLLGAQPDDPHDLIVDCLNHPDLLTQWEIKFLLSLREFAEPSPKQLAILERLAAKVRAAS